MIGSNFIMPVLCLFCGALIVGVIFFRVTARPHLAQYLLCALMGFLLGLMGALLTLPLAESVLSWWYLQGSFSQLRQVLYSVRLCLWLGGGAVPGALIGILMVQWSRRKR
jgi:hypothetical protein